MPSSPGLDCTKLAYQTDAFCETQSCPRPANVPFSPWAAQQGWDTLAAGAEGGEVCAAGGSQLWEGVVMCSPGTSSATLWLLCDSRDAPSSQSQGQSLHRGSAQHCQSCHYFLLRLTGSRTSFNLCADKKHTMSALRFVFSWLQICQGKNIWKLISACQIGQYFVHHEQIDCKKLGDTQEGM